MDTINLLQETINSLENHGKSITDVKWVGNNEAKTTWENFAKLANIQYNADEGGLEVAEDLLIVGEDFWLERHHSDYSSEWWEFKTAPQEPARIEKLRAVTETQGKALGYSVEMQLPSLQVGLAEINMIT